MKPATLKISRYTDRKNGWGMPIVEITSDNDIKVINRGYNEFEAVNEIDETDLLRLREYFSAFSNSTIHLEITTPSRQTCCWYSLDRLSGSRLMW